MTQTSVEIREIHGLPGYGASPDGRVWSSKVGHHWKEMAQQPSRGGYLRVGVMLPSGKRFSAGVHRLVAMAFIGEIGTDLEVNHLDGNKINNAVCNLEITTRLGNTRHAWAMGLHAPHHKTKGESHGMSKLTESQVEEIRRRYKEGGVSHRTLAKAFGVSYYNIFLILNNKTWVK